MTGDLDIIRRASSGASKDLREFQRAVTQLKKRMVAAAQNEGRFAFRRMASMYEAGFVSDKRGVMVKVKRYGAAWGKRKKQLGLDLRRGVARKGVLKTIKSPKAFVKHSDGFEIDLNRPNITVTGRATLGRSKRTLAGKVLFRHSDGRLLTKGGSGAQIAGMTFKRIVTNKRSFAVNNYLEHFADQKAPGLGTLLKTDMVKIAERAGEAASQHIANLESASRQALGKKAQAVIKLRLDKLTA